MANLQWIICLVYLDDLIVFSKTFDEAVERLDTVFQCLVDAGLKLNPGKCCLFQKKVQYLGFEVSEEGIDTCKSKVKAVVDWPVPKNLTEVRSFLGTCSYYRKFVKDFAQIAKPLFFLTEKNRPFVWDEETQKAFETLKNKLTSSPILAFPNEDDPFIIDCDASAVGLGCVLSQMQNKTERVIAFYSRTLNKLEWNYCTTRRELLAIVAAIKHFRHYLLGKKFLIRTDHSSLRWVTKCKTPEGQLARWLEVLSQYQFDIEYRPGRFHGNADGLSRRPCDGQECKQCEKMANNMNEKPVHVPKNRKGRKPKSQKSDSKSQTSKISPEKVCRVKKSKSSTSRKNDTWIQGFSSEELRQLQSEDPEIGEIYRLIARGAERPGWDDVCTRPVNFLKYWECWADLVVINGVLHRRRLQMDPRKPLLVLPCKLRKGALRQLHDARCSGHLGQDKTFERVRERYFWVGQHREVVEWVRKCPKCIQKLKPSKHVKPSMTLHNVDAPMERIGLDILGPLPVSDRGNRFILCIGDYFSKWITSIPIVNQEASTIATVLIESIISVFGVPKQIHTDKGANFESKLLTQLCSMLGVRKTRTTSFHPSGNGFIERWNRTLQHSLKLYTSKNQRDWDLHLPYVNMAYRSSVQSSIGYTPNEVFLGRNIALPVDRIIERETMSKSRENIHEYVARQQEPVLYQVHCAARKNNKKASERQKQHHGKNCASKSPKPNYTVGDQVWYYRPARKKGVCPKLQSFWEGPFTVVQKINPVLYRIKSSRGSQSMVVNVQKLKLDISRDEPSDTNLDFFGEIPKSSTSRPTEMLSESHQMPHSSSKGRTLKKPQWYGICF